MRYVSRGEKREGLSGPNKSPTREDQEQDLIELMQGGQKPNSHISQAEKRKGRGKFGSKAKSQPGKISQERNQQERNYKAAESGSPVNTLSRNCVASDHPAGAIQQWQHSCSSAQGVYTSGPTAHKQLLQEAPPK